MRQYPCNAVHADPESASAPRPSVQRLTPHNRGTAYLQPSPLAGEIAVAPVSDGRLGLARSVI